MRKPNTGGDESSNQMYNIIVYRLLTCVVNVQGMEGFVPNVSSIFYHIYCLIVITMFKDNPNPWTTMKERELYSESVPWNR